MFVNISLDCAVSQRPLWGILVRLPRPLSLIFPYLRGLMIVLRRSLHGVVSDGHVFGLLIPLPPAVLIACTQEANISFESTVGQILFLSAMLVVFHPRYQSTLIPFPPSKRPMRLHGFMLTLCFLVVSAGSLPGPYTPCGIRVPNAEAEVT